MYARDLVLSQALLEKDKGRTDVGQKEYGRNCRNKHDILIIRKDLALIPSHTKNDVCAYNLCASKIRTNSMTA